MSNPTDPTGADLTPETPVTMSAEQLETLLAQAAAKGAESVTKRSPSFLQGSESASIIPPTVKRYGSIKNFTGKDADVRAYRFGMWCLAAATGNENAVKYCADNGLGLTKAAHTESNNATGGFSVPEEFGTDMIDLREKYGVFRRNARIVPMTGDTRIDPRRTGGLTAYFKGESATLTESEKSWDQVALTAKKLTALARYTSELNEDSVLSIGDDLAYEIAYAFALKEDECGFNGDASSTYGGITGVRQRLVDKYTTGGGAGLIVASGNLYSEITLADFNNVIGALPEYADAAAKWYCSKAFWGSVMQKLIAGATGANATDVINGARVKEFLGYPVEVSQVMPKTGANSQVCCFFGDLRMAASFGDRRATTITFSEHANGAFENDEILLKGTERFDISVHDVGSASEAGPIVGLITAGS